VVDAAGAWLRAVAALSGAKVAVVPTRHQLLITEPIDGVDAMQPITRIIDVNVYARPDEGGLMLGGYEQSPLQYDKHALPPRFDIADLPLDLGVLRGLLMPCERSCQSSSACPGRSSCACIAADCRR
jgi:4-methylaminobutanoate oxidase (formaldehyde-forming)